MKGVFSALTVLQCALYILHQSAYADLYMNNPRGSNNKLNEVSDNVRNDNRLFDSQNNAAAGYQVGDKCVGGRWDYLHMQWTGSDANQAGNAGNGMQMTDRSLKAFQGYKGRRLESHKKYRKTKKKKLYRIPNSLTQLLSKLNHSYFFLILK